MVVGNVGRWDWEFINLQVTPAPKDAPYPDFCMARGRFGSHNTQCWVAPGLSRPNIMAIAWFNAEGAWRANVDTHPAVDLHASQWTPGWQKDHGELLEIAGLPVQ